VLLRDHLVARLAEHAQRDLVRHRRRGHVDRLLLSEQLGRHRLEPVHGRVLAALLVTDLGRSDRGAHLRRGLGLGVGAEVDHQAPFGASNAAAAVAGSAERSGCSPNRYRTTTRLNALTSSRPTPRLPALTSSSRPTTRPCGADLASSGSSAASRAIAIIASANSSSVSLASVSVGSIISASGTTSGKDPAGGGKP